jgi:hypothetical protein
VPVRLFQSQQVREEAVPPPGLPAQGPLLERAQREVRRELSTRSAGAMLVTRTDAEGRFEFADLPDGDYLVAVRLPAGEWRAGTPAPGAVRISAQGPHQDLGTILLVRVEK